MVNREYSISKKTTPIKPLLSLKPYILKYKYTVICAGIALLLAALVTLIVPLGVRHIIDFGFSSQSTNVINEYYYLMIFLAGILAVASAARFYFVNWLGERIIADLRADIFSRMTTLSIDFYEKNHSGEVMSRLTADTTQIKTAVSIAASQTLRNIIMIFGSVIMMFMTSFYLSCLVIISIPFIILPLIMYGKVVKRLSREAQDTLADASAFAGERISNIKILQAFTNEKKASSYFKKAVNLAFDAAKRRNQARGGLTAIAIFLVFSSVISILWLGAQEVVLGTITAGTLGQFILYSILAAGAMGEMSEVWGEIQQASGAAERLMELLNKKSQILQPVNPKFLTVPTKGGIIFRDVSFTYPSREEQTVLEEISFTIKPGENIAIVGPSGAGKSTILNLLLRFHDVEHGQILIDDVEIDELCINNLRQSIAIVPQNTVLFSGTIYDNIVFGNPDATHEQVIEAAKTANAHDFISSLSKGYDTELGEKGMSLSGGQQQRIAIARAVLKKASIFLLDEATSALDTENEVLVQEALNKITENKTTLIIAHRLSTVQKADRILVLDKGKIVEVGNHQSLVEKGGIYARLANLQFSA